MRPTSNPSPAPLERARLADRRSALGGGPGVSVHNQGGNIKTLMISDYLPSDKMYQKLVENGDHKVLKPFSATLVHVRGAARRPRPQGPHAPSTRSSSALQSILAGFYLGWGATVAMFVGGLFLTENPANQAVYRIIYGERLHLSPPALLLLLTWRSALPASPAACTFPVGLIMIVMMGSELFTGDVIVSTVAWLEGDVQWWRFLLSLLFSYFGNLVGSLIVVMLIQQSGLMALGVEVFPYFLAHKKAGAYPPACPSSPAPLLRRRLCPLLSPCCPSSPADLCLPICRCTQPRLGRTSPARCWATGWSTPPSSWGLPPPRTSARSSASSSASSSLAPSSSSTASQVSGVQ